MKLSEAIREGAIKTGKLEGGFASTGRDGDTEACALGAAFVELTGDVTAAADGDKVLNFIADEYPLVKNPQCIFHQEEIVAAGDRIDEQFAGTGMQFPKELLQIKKEIDDVPGQKSCLCRTKKDIMNEIMTRNDGGESRESIADWLETLGL